MSRNKNRPSGKAPFPCDLRQLESQGKTNALLIIENEKIVYASPVYREMMGYQPGEEIETNPENIRDHVHPDDLEDLDRIISEALSRKQTELHYSFREKTRHGDYILREDYARFIYDKAGNHIRTYVVCRKADATEDTSGTDLSGQPDTIKVLIAEDNRMNMMLIHQMLINLLPEVTILQAPNGKEAVSLFRKYHPDLILMDIHMPEMDGYQASQEIRSEEFGTGNRTPIIAITAKLQTGEKERCLHAGMDAYLPKPVNEEDFNREVMKYVQKINKL